MNEAIDLRGDAVESVVKRFSDFGRGAPEVVAYAPGRVNVIGEHVDYNGGWVLPAALEYCVAIALSARDDGMVRLYSENMAAKLPEFPVTDLEVSQDRCWSNYVKGVIAGLTARGFKVPGFDVCLKSDIPIGGGLSSSAALEAVFGIALLELMGKSMEGIELAKLCQTAEHEYAGVPCGLMDQAAVILCKEGHLLLLDCQTETFEHAPFSSPEWGLLVVNSGVAHELADGEYGKRRTACHEAAKILKLDSLRDLSSSQLEDALKTEALSEEMVRCVRHVVTENARTRILVEALKVGDYDAAGKAMNESHRSLKDDYKVSCDELDFIAKTAQDLFGVAGCRMTGGGFGGSAIALVKLSEIETVSQKLCSAYEAKFGFAPKAFATRPMSGAKAWRFEG